MYRLLFCVLFLALLLPRYASAQFSSEILYYEGDRLTYVSDDEGNRIPDFSHAGYRGGGIALPVLPSRVILHPQPGDDTVRIQRAIRSVSRMPADHNGHRGAVELKPGVYEISDNLVIESSGIVLKGAGDGMDPAKNSILRISESVQGTVLQIGTDRMNWHRSEDGSETYITSDFVPVGARSFEVEDTSIFEPGDNIIIRHPGTQKWINAVDGGGTADGEEWQPGYHEIYYNRYITDISGNVISIDAPVYNHLDRNLSQSYIYKLVRTHLVTESGVENLRIQIQSRHALDETHAENGVIFRGVENGWAKNVTVLHFQNSGIATHTSSFITVKNSRALQPHSPLSGGKRYNFNAMHFSNNILFTEVVSTNGRRDFVSNGTSVVSGIVFHKARSVGAISSSEGHQKWSQALLFDTITFENPKTESVVSLHNRGDLGSSHGWTTAHSVAWNIDAGGKSVYIQKPPTAQNYGIGIRGRLSGDGWFDQPDGYMEGAGLVPDPASLYDAQLRERLKRGNAPDPPFRLTVIPEKNGEGKSLSWNYIFTDAAMEFIIERAENGETIFEELARIPGGETTFEDDSAGGNSYGYRVRADVNGIRSAYSNQVKMHLPAPVEEEKSEEVTEAEGGLSQNFPNPFNPRTNIHYRIPESGHVTFEVFNMAGVRVAELDLGMRPAGAHNIQFDGSGLSSGVYIYRLKGGEFVFTRKMVLLK